MHVNGYFSACKSHNLYSFTTLTRKEINTFNYCLKQTFCGHKSVINSDFSDRFQCLVSNLAVTNHCFLSSVIIFAPPL